MNQIKTMLRQSSLLMLLLGLSSCYLPEIQLREYLRPIRRLFNQERTYWTDKMALRGGTGTELVYYKNGRPALEKHYNEKGLLKTINYLGREGESIRMDSLVYVGETLIAGYYFAEPGHDLILRFRSYKQQGQLSQRSWFGSMGELLSREFFLFDRHGRRQVRMIFDEKDSLLYSELYRGDTDKLDIQNTYSQDGYLVSQVRYNASQPPFRYDFNQSGSIIQMTQLHQDNTPDWSSELLYSKDGQLERCNFRIHDRVLFTYLGDIEFNWQSSQTWQHPFQPGNIGYSYKVGHRDPFVIEKMGRSDHSQVVEVRLPESGALFKRSVLDTNGRHVADTLYYNRGNLQPASVMVFDTMGFTQSEITYDLLGQAKWNHTWYRDDNNQIIREELIALPDSFISAVTRFYDPFGLPALSERFTAPNSFGSWVSYHGGGVNKTLFYNQNLELAESWLFRPAGDTSRHSLFQTVDYIRVESKFGKQDTLLSQRRFTEDGILNWELFFNNRQEILQETHRKKDGSVYREVSYNHESRVIKSNTYAPIDIEEREGEDHEKGELSSQVITRLNPDGKVVQIVSRNSSGGISWEKRYAFREGKLLKSAQLGSDGKPLVISSYQYDDRGQLHEETARDQAGTLVHTVKYKYNDQRELVWKIFSSILTGMESSNRYYYGDDGRLKRNEIIESKRLIEAVEYEYFPQYYLRIATHYDPDGLVIRKEIENYFGDNVFALAPIKNMKEK